MKREFKATINIRLPVSMLEELDSRPGPRLQHIERAVREMLERDRIRGKVRVDPQTELELELEEHSA